MGAERAMPAGHSEHNLGLSLDVGSSLSEMNQAPEGKWLAANAWKYGFKMHPAEPQFLWHKLTIGLENPGFIARNIERGNLVPFHEISAALKGGTEHRMLNFVGNIAVFVPFGMLLPFAFGSARLTLTRAIFVAIAYSLLLEGSQAVLSIGQFDVDDLLLNAFGGWLGCVLIRCARIAWRLIR